MSFEILDSNFLLEHWLKKQKCPIIFIPTMGALHEGHISLIKRSKRDNSKINPSIIVSIFINPLQFGKNEDFDRYPRNIKQDCQLATEAGANAIWIPSLNDVFPGGSKNHFHIKAPETISSKLCGAMRSGHFDGVATVVIRLLNLVKPTILVLGEKDWQQLIVLRRLISEFSIPTKIQSFPTVRDNQGMAYSSRNRYLDPLEQRKALNLYKELQTAKELYKNRKEIDLSTIATNLKRNGLNVEYLKIVGKETLEEKKGFKNICLLAAAVKCGSTRLIDHIFLMHRLPIVAIDGPAGAGKSTVSKAFADKLGLLYLDTGAMYRAVTWFLEKNKIDLENQSLIKESLENFELKLAIDNNGQQIVLANQQNITNDIRSPEITSKVSLIATHNVVRENLTRLQQKIGLNGGLVAEGRDIGTAVFPEAEVKIFLTASALERAKRRSEDLRKRGYKVDSIHDIENQIKERDKLDSNREIAPLKKAEDAVELITDGMNINEVLDSLIEIFRSKIPEEVWSSTKN